MTKITAISDTHGRHRDVKIKKTDVLIHCGDISNFGTSDDISDYGKWLESQPCDHVICVAGNHDSLFEKNPKLTKKLLRSAIYLENNSVEIDGLKIFGSPVTPSFFGAFNFNDEKRQMIWEKIPDNLDILITHCPPLGILDKTLDFHSVGDGYLMAKVMQVKPRFHLFGHIHSGYGVVKSRSGTTFINCSLMNDSMILNNKPVVFTVNKKNL